MADIFISYKKEDAGRVVRIVEGLRQEGFSVWWDHGIAPGSQWDQTIQRELNDAKCVVAVWSELSISAPWVKEEAGVGKSRNALVPIRIDDVEPPLGFGLIQAADLWDWDGDIEDPHWDFFIESIRAVMTGEPVKGLEKPAKRRRLNFGLVAGVLAALIIAAGVGLWAGGFLNGTSITSTTTIGGGPAEPTEAEEALFAKAQESRLKTDYQDYIRSFPQGFYAKRVREEILPVCEGETRKVWQPNPVPIGQMFRASSEVNPLESDSILHPTEDAACAQAKANYEDQADRYCRTIAASQETRNINVAINHADCDCQQSAGQYFCFVDSNYSCSYEVNMDTFVEVCG
ncbi:MAG: toll/interleukin-1 receptor domain-containing protein [Pseudomonadota bacterium]